MTRLSVVVLAAVSLGPLASCGDDPPDPFDDDRCRQLLNDAASGDAFDWLKGPAPVPRRPGAMTVDEALALAHEFEARGAVRLVAVGNKTLDAPGLKGPVYTSRGVVIQLPDDPASRFRVFALYAKLAQEFGFRPRADAGQTYLFVGWKHD